MEDFKPVNTLEEIRKLQDLVRKLEIQNLQLRNRQNINRKRSVSPEKDSRTSKSCWSVNKKSDVKASNFRSDYEGKSFCDNLDEYFDDLEIIKVSDIELSDDESWLYSSPKSAKPDQSNENTLKWVLRDADNPVNKQLQLAKKSLLSKLNELESSQKSKQAHVDSKTFIRTKRKPATVSLEEMDMYTSETANKTNVVKLQRRGSDVSSDSISSCNVLEYASDVEEVARMQEESLRLTSPSETSQHYSTYHHRYLESSLYSEGSLYHYSLPSPPKTPYGSDASLHNTGSGKGKLGAYRRSLPNLNMHSTSFGQSKTKFCRDSSSHIQSQGKGLPLMKRSDIPLCHQQKARKDIKSFSRIKHQDQVASLETSFKIRGNPIPVSLVPRSANSANTKLPARMSLPRSAKASSSKSTTRSGIPMASIESKKNSENSWSEGCY